MEVRLTHSLSESREPAIRMHYNDHRKFISTGSGQDSQDWQATQADLISRGKFDEIRAQYGTEYDAAIKQMVDEMPKNRAFLAFLTKNEWTINYCQLK